MLVCPVRCHTRWVIYTYEHGLLYVSGRTLWFFVYDVETLCGLGVSCCTAVLMNGGGGLEVFFDSAVQ